MTHRNRLNEHKVALKKIVEIFNTGDLSEVNVIFSPDYIDHQKPPGLDVNGPDEFKQIVMGARTSLLKLKVTIEDLIAEDDKVVARLQWHSTDLVGKKIDRETIDILRFVNGQVVEHWGAETWTSENSSRDQVQEIVDP
jgi:predicted SnoaL-like aldol condensation-catalyzing enzyme